MSWDPLNSVQLIFLMKFKHEFSFRNLNSSPGLLNSSQQKISCLFAALFHGTSL